MTHYRDDDERGESRFARLRHLGKADYHGKGGFLIFVFFRILEFILSIIVLGLAAHFLNIYKFGSGEGLPVLLWVMLAFAITAVIETSLSLVFMLDRLHTKGLGVITACDAVLLIGFIYLSVAYGYPLADIGCGNPVGNLAEEVAYFNPGAKFPELLTGNATYDMRMLALTSVLNCKEIRLVWVLAVALAVSFFLTWMLVAGLFYKQWRNRHTHDGGSHDGGDSYDRR